MTYTMLANNYPSGTGGEGSEPAHAGGQDGPTGAGRSERGGGAAASDTTTRRRRIGVMGGTFDPIHHGHLVAASEVAHEFDLDEVVFVPTGEQPFKRGKKVAPAEHRYLMCVVATAANPRFTVSRVDIDRGGITYTIDTLRDLHAARPEADLYFITGADALERIMEWKDVDELFKLAHFVGVTRPGHEMDTRKLTDLGVWLVDIPAMAISSTDCRARVAKGGPVWYLVPDGVVQYIAKFDLYREN
ncbi:nicotinate-nucleotide adenylyltransferase [Buchananella felis]|uniref:nicotinate-nucleotide adenylyltransferase n=2 Tax=Buchananella felis TaxID=3231492 RepID=UPI00352702D2